MSDYVVDASVLAKWILSGEPYEEIALRLKDDNVKGVANLHSPSISLYELGNVLWKATKKSRISSDGASKALEAIALMRLSFHELNQDDISKSFKIAYLLNMTVYDASYLHLSVKLSIPLLTADEKLSTASKSGYKVVQLKDY
jgi:predicted nucleic acid-binding protein